jgi:hypothetical protein
MMKTEDMIPFERILEEDVQNPELRAEWERTAPASADRPALIAYRIDKACR